MTTSIKNRVPSSFRDPNGFVFKHDGIVYRQVSNLYKTDFQLLHSSGLYEHLLSKNSILAYKEVELNQVILPNNTFKILLPEQIPFISYPHEWPFSQLKDSALLTLDIAKDSLNHGCILKDATAYNTQLVAGKIKHIDSLSFEKYKEGGIWEAYKQYCENFLGPLELMSKVDPTLSKMLMTELDGIPITLVDKLIPLHKKIDYRFLLHISMHGKSQTRSVRKDENFSPKYKLDKRSLLNIINNLHGLTESLKIPDKKTVWGDYYSNNSYTDTAFVKKKELVEKYISKLNPNVTWDLGANTGIFTEIASEHSNRVIAIDSDHKTIEKLYLRVKETNLKNVYPIVGDLTNPAPAIGWENQERASLLQRRDADLVLALALMHHLVIAKNIPFEYLAELFSKLARHLIIEFIPKTDNQVQRLLRSRKDIFYDYTQEHFEEVFGRHYNIIAKSRIEQSDRILYLMEKI